MDISDHIKDLIPEIKLLILSNLHIQDLSKLKIPQNQAEIIFKYRYSSYYIKVKNIIKVNKELNFDEYTEESPYLWSILLRDELFLEVNSAFKSISCSYRINYINHESITINCMIKFYQSHPQLYIYLNKLLEDKCGIYLLYDVIVNRGFNSHGNVDKILDHKDIINVSKYNQGRTVIPIIILIYFIKQFKNTDKLIYDKAIILSNLKMLLNDDGRYSYDESFYDRYQMVINKYLDML